MARGRLAWPGVSLEVPTLAGSCSQGPSLQGPTGRAPKIKPARPAGAVARLHTPESGSAGKAKCPSVEAGCDLDGEVEPAAIVTLPRRWRRGLDPCRA